MSNKYNQKKQSEQGLNLLGKVIPQAIDVEEAVLGALMTETKSFHRIEGKLSKEDFYLPKHQLIFEAMNNLSLRNEPIDILTIAEEIKKMGEIDTVSPVEIVNLSSRVASSVHLEYHCSILNEKSLKRKLISVTSDIQNQSFDESIGASETLENLEKSFTDLNNKSSGYESIGINEAIQLAINKANQAQVDHQSGKITAIPTHLNALDRAFEGGWRSPDLIILGGRPSMGKALRSDEVILTPKGWVKNIDLKIGDEVVSIDGKQSFVKGIYPKGKLKTYEVEFSDGRVVECCENHLWEVNSSRFRDKTKVIETKELIRLLSLERYKRRISIPLFCGEFGDEKDFIIHPYILGVLLGDGSCGSSLRWCKPDKFIANKISGILDENHSVNELKYNFYSIVGNGNSNNLLTEYDKLGLKNKRSFEKFIPETYLNSSREQRLHLLNGLLDTDGDVDKNGAICFNSTSKQLANDVQSLCWSLGYKCSIRKRKSYLYGVRHKDSYRLVIGSHNPQELFSLPRKKERAIYRDIKPLTIVSIKEKGVEDCQCISVSHPRRLYITRDYIVTHNTQHSLSIAMSAANAGLDCLFVSIEMTSVQLVNRLLLESDNISSYNLRTGQLRADEWQALDDRIGALTNKALHIADNHNIRYLSNIKTEARRLHRKGKLKLLIIDYLQLIKTNMRFERRQLEVAHITGELKALAKELEIPIIALSQLSRPAKGMAVKEPDLEDLREAGDIEQDADIVVFIHKPDYYNPSLSEWKNKGMLLIRKSREGVRNEGVMFEHDDRYKKIFDCNNTPSSSQSDVPF